MAARALLFGAALAGPRLPRAGRAPVRAHEENKSLTRWDPPCADSGLHAKAAVMVETLAIRSVRTVQAAAVQAGMAAAPVARAVATFGSAGNMAFAAALGAGAFVVALASGPMETPAVAASVTPVQSAAATAPARAADAPVVRGPVAEAAPAAPAPTGTAPAPAIENVLDYAVAFYWPARPQTVAEPVALREAPAGYARVIRAARPGERLRINGRVADAPGGPWLRVRLADGRDGYFAARTLDVGAFRSRRAAAATTGTGADVAAAESGAPFVVLPPAIAEESEIGPPSF